MIQKRSIAVIVILVFLGVPSAWVFCQDTAQKEKNEDALKKNDKKTGIIFNVTDILLDLESYQGGVGIKRYSTDSLAYRVSFDFNYTDKSSSWLLVLGNTLEYHFIRGRVSPYFGGFLDIGYATYKDESDSNNWTKVSSIPLSIGPIFGVEVNIFEFLALFAEYSVSFDYTTTKTTTSDAGSESVQKESGFSIGTGMGNESKIGVVIYFNRIEK